MRTSRAVLTGVVVLASIGFLPSPAAQAVAPSAPYTALFIDNNTLSPWDPGTVLYDSTNGSTITASATDTDQVDFRAEKGSDSWVFRIAPPIGSTWTIGTEYDISAALSPTQAYLDVSHPGNTCDKRAGRIQVHDVVRGDDDVLTGFAATFAISCSWISHGLGGELRWNSDTPYAAAATDVTEHDFGGLFVGGEPSAKTITVTSLGTVPTVFGDATLTPFSMDGDAFAVTGNTCSGTSRAYGETCTVTVTATATLLTTLGVMLELADNTALGTRQVVFQMHGVNPRTVTVSPSRLTFDSQTVGEVSTPQRVTVTSTGVMPITFSAARIAGTDASHFVVTTDACEGVSLAKGQTCYVEVAAKPTRPGPKSATLELPSNSVSSPWRGSLSITNSVENLRGTYTPVRPTRILDTRSGLGAPKALVQPGKVVRLKVAGRGGIPASGASAVVLNVTVTDTTGNGHLTVYPTGVARPTASSLNYPRNGLRSNSVTVQLGTSGYVDIYTNSGTHIVADVSGWYASADANSADALGGQIQLTSHQRLFDSRSDWGKPLRGGEYAQIPVSGGSKIRAVVVNITAVDATSRGYLTAWDGVGARPVTSTVNYLAKTATPNLAIVPIGPCDLCEGGYHGGPSISIYSSVTSHLVVDVVGFIDDGTMVNGLRFEPREPQRIVDSRQGLGLSGKLGSVTTKTVTLPASVLPAGTQALALNVTGVSATANTYLSVWPFGPGRSTASTLNLAAGQTAANATMVRLSNTNQFNVFNNSGSVDVVFDVVGTFWLYPGTAQGSGTTGLSTNDGGTGLERLDPELRPVGGTATARGRVT